MTNICRRSIEISLSFSALQIFLWFALAPLSHLNVIAREKDKSLSGGSLTSMDPIVPETKVLAIASHVGTPMPWHASDPASG